MFDSILSFIFSFINQGISNKNKMHIYNLLIVHISGFFLSSIILAIIILLGRTKIILYINHYEMLILLLLLLYVIIKYSFSYKLDYFSKEIQKYFFIVFLLIDILQYSFIVFIIYHYSISNFIILTIISMIVFNFISEISLFKIILTLQDYNLSIQPSKIHGNGVVTKYKIPVGRVIYNVPINKISYKPFPKWAYIGNNKWVCDEKILNNINHSCNPNAKLELSEPIRLIARRSINPNEEITLDYNETEINGTNVKCNCQDKDCRKTFLRIE
jgi:hypothetical protein